MDPTLCSLEERQEVPVLGWTGTRPAGGLSYCTPAAGDGGAAGRAVPRRVQLVADDAVAAALDQEAQAFRASSVLEVGYLAREVAGVDIVQTCLAADVDRKSVV